MAVYDTPDRAILTPSSPLVATSIAVALPLGVRGILMLMSIINGSSTAQTASVSLFDEDATTTGLPANLVYGGILGASQVIQFGPDGIPLRKGLATVISAAINANMVLVYAYRVR
jgi:hypothetical protein